MHPDYYRHYKKTTPMTRNQIRAEFKKMDANNERSKPCGQSFNELMKELSK